MRTPLTTEQFITRAKNVHGDTYDYRSVAYTRSCNKVIITCMTHGDFLQTPNRHLAGTGCPACARRVSRSIRDYLCRYEPVISGKVVYTGNDHDKVVTKDYRIQLSCVTHGKFNIAMYDVHSGRGCGKCKGNGLSGTYRLTKLMLRHSGKYTYPDFAYKGGTKHIRILCDTHGEFSQSYSNHVWGTGCPSCAISGFGNPAIAYLYVVNLGNEFCGFGITADIGTRLRVHRKAASKTGVFIESVADFELSGGDAKQLELDIKRNFDIVNSGIDGFRREAIPIQKTGELLDFINSRI